MQAGWHRADIVAAIHKRGTTLSALAKRHKLGDSTLRAALSKPSSPSNRIISKFLRIPLHELWPAWFDEDGGLITYREPATGRRIASSQKRRAA